MRDLEQPPEVVADPGGAVVEAREVRRRAASARDPPSRATAVRLPPAPPRPAGSRPPRPRRACTAGHGDRVRGEQPFADRRRADVAIGLIVRRLDRRPPRPAALGHGSMPRDERVARHAHDRHGRAVRHAPGRRCVRDVRRGDDEQRGAQFDQGYSGHSMRASAAAVAILTCGACLGVAACGGSKDEASPPPAARRSRHRP